MEIVQKIQKKCRNLLVGFLCVFSVDLFAQNLGRSCTQSFELASSVSVRGEGEAIDYKWKGRSEVKLIEMSSSHLELPQVKRDRFDFDGSKFDIVNVGLKKSIEDSESFLEMIQVENSLNTKSNIRVLSTGERRRTELELARIRKIVIDRVIKNYERVKGEYLSKVDLSYLEETSKHGHNFDNFVVFKSLKKSLAKSSKKELDDSLMANIQLNYQGDIQSWDSGFKYAESYRKMSDYLPFESRLSADRLLIFHSELKNNFKGLSLAEITRYNRFEVIPEELNAVLLLKLLQKSKDMGVDVLVISVDRFTKRLFTRKFGFTLYDKILTSTVKDDFSIVESNKATEYLLYLKTKSNEFVKLVENLKNIAGETNSKAMPY